MIHVLLFDDHAMVRQGLRTMPEAYQASMLAHTSQLDVVLMDIHCHY